MLVVALVAVLLLMAGCSAGAPAPASDVRETSATLNGMVFSIERDTDVQYWFRYGTTTAYGQQTPEATVHVPAGSGNFVRVSTPVTGLTPFTTYHYQLCTAPPRPSCLPNDAELTAGPAVVVSSLRSDDLAIWRMDAGGHDPVQLTSAPPFGASRPTGSPDGRRIAFSRYLTGNAAIYVMDADGANLHAITDGSSFAQDPAWSPDGTRIAFSDNRDGDWDIWVMDTDGSNPTQVTDDPGVDYQPAWSPDGARLAFSGAHTGPDDFEVYSIDVDGENEMQLTDGGGHGPSWSPDGSTISFFRGLPNDIWSMDADGGNQRNLTDSADEEAWPAWAPDGSRIAFARSASTHGEIWTMDPDGNDQVRLGPESRLDTQPAWLPQP